MWEIEACPSVKSSTRGLTPHSDQIPLKIKSSSLSLIGSVEMPLASAVERQAARMPFPWRWRSSKLRNWWMRTWDRQCSTYKAKVCVWCQSHSLLPSQRPPLIPIYPTATTTTAMWLVCFWVMGMDLRRLRHPSSPSNPPQSPRMPLLHWVNPNACLSFYYHLPVVSVLIS